MGYEHGKFKLHSLEFVHRFLVLVAVAPPRVVAAPNVRYSSDPAPCADSAAAMKAIGTQHPTKDA